VLIENSVLLVILLFGNRRNIYIYTQEEAVATVNGI